MINNLDFVIRLKTLKLSSKTLQLKKLKKFINTKMLKLYV